MMALEQETMTNDKVQIILFQISKKILEFDSKIIKKSGFEI